MGSEGSWGLGGRMESGPDLAAVSPSRETLDPFLGVEHGYSGPSGGVVVPKVMLRAEVQA